MASIFDTPEDYIASLPEDRKAPVSKLHEIITENLPEGFKTGMTYGMIGYFVPHSIYSQGYHVDPKQPLPFINLASQKNFIALYHMGIYANPALLTWFREEYPKHSSTKLDMGKSCIRFKNPEKVPYKLMAQLVTKMTVKEWISTYKDQVKKK